MHLIDLVGRHWLTGVESGVIDKGSANSMTFILDGKEITAIENEDDGYRSALGDLSITPEAVVKNTFPRVRVEAVMNPYEDILEFTDIKSGLVVLQIGTDNSDDYYPCFIANFNPKNMFVNQPVEGE
jgi:hypothetical protein